MNHSIEELLACVENVNPEDKALITKAFSFSKQAHITQERNSGEPYFNHVFHVACILAKMDADAVTISAGLMHDVLEDTDITEEEMTKEFGDEIVFLVQGVTKLGHLKYKGVERHAESLSTASSRRQTRKRHSRAPASCTQRKSNPRLTHGKNHLCGKNRRDS
jgi:GTP pyrophosphokinase